jgi:hypothetical protein
VDLPEEGHGLAANPFGSEQVNDARREWASRIPPGTDAGEVPRAEQVREAGPGEEIRGEKSGEISTSARLG